VRGGVGDLVISRNPLAGGAQIDAATAAALSAEDWRLRLGAVTELTQYVRGGGGAARAARLLLQRQVEQERDYAVRMAISAALEPFDAAARPVVEPDDTRARPVVATTRPPVVEIQPPAEISTPHGTIPRWPTKKAAIIFSLVVVLAVTVAGFLAVNYNTGSNAVRYEPSSAPSKVLNPAPPNYNPAPSKLGK